MINYKANFSTGDWGSAGNTKQIGFLILTNGEYMMSTVMSMSGSRTAGTKVIITSHEI